MKTTNGCRSNIAKAAILTSATVFTLLAVKVLYNAYRYRIVVSNTPSVPNGEFRIGKKWENADELFV